jgi:hypothetical protein
MKAIQIQQADIKLKVGGYIIEISIVLSPHKCHERSIDLKRVSEITSVTFSGKVLSGTGRALCAYQIVPTLRDIGLDEAHPALGELCDIWERWHLNDRRNGTREQIEIIEEQVPSLVATYSGKCQILKNLGMLKDRGFEYGTDLLVEPLPLEVEKEIRQIVADLGSEFRIRSC